jgi:hypothetical protein
MSEATHLDEAGLTHFRISNTRTRKSEKPTIKLENMDCLGIKAFNFYPSKNKKYNDVNKHKTKEKKTNVKQHLEENTNESTINGNTQKRRDKYGIPIIKGMKSHSVTFIDEFDGEEKLIEIIEVDSYKEFNVDVSKNPDAIEYREANICNCLVM